MGPGLKRAGNSEEISPSSPEQARECNGGSSPKPHGIDAQLWADCGDQMLHSVRPRSLWLLQALTVLLLLASADRGAAALPKAVLSLQPPWINLLQEDNVTLSCQGPHSLGNSPTRWFHNGNPIPAQVQPSYHLQVSSNDSGNYSCQSDQTSLSDPVHLDVISDWLLLQTPRLVFQAGEPIKLRCHSWRNRPLHKITFYHNGKSKMFSHQNSSFSIPQANASHSGEYHCLGIIGHTQHMSQPVTITIQVPAVSPFFLLWQIAFCLVMGLLFAVDTGLYFAAQRALRSSLRKGGNDNVTWSRSPQDK
ncbi:low affinity immunoglobulin gamma Fc region receptor III isoform X1 [Rhinolophus sinicus]|uniref:low affinity immunoglobulin gamma Fc region receptor III isoform X1 n=1 Tax=Rhinolophus sinicus TaxID=89399 RepID=UPI003D7B0AD0